MSLTRLVLDNSIIVAWALDESQTAADRIMESLDSIEAWVPVIWPLELANALLAAERHGRITEAEGEKLRERILALPITVVQEPPERTFRQVLGLAREHSLTVYDASYLDLALQRGAALATLDQRLAAAAKSCSVALFSGQ